MKKSTLSCLVIAAAFVIAPLDARSQASSPDPEKAPAKKDVAKKDAPKKDAAKKDAANKKDAKPAAKPANAPAKGTAGKTSRNVTVYTNTPPPPLKDKDGKVIPVTPDAYDVSSALPKKK